MGQRDNGAPFLVAQWGPDLTAMRLDHPPRDSKAETDAAAPLVEGLETVAFCKLPDAIGVGDRDPGRGLTIDLAYAFPHRQFRTVHQLAP